MELRTAAKHVKNFFITAAGAPWRDYDDARIRTRSISVSRKTGGYDNFVFDAVRQSDDRWAIEKIQQDTSFAGVHEIFLEQVGHVSSKQEAISKLEELEKSLAHTIGYGRKSKNHFSLVHN